MSGDITYKMLQGFSEKYNSDYRNKVMESIITVNGIKNAALNKEAVNRDINVFSIELPKAKICNQKKSGRCWAFAGLNILKREAAQKLDIDLETFELSQNYITFYDKLEKANNFYETIIDFKDKDLMDRELVLVLNEGLYEGGHWQYFIELVRKYGVVPKNIMPESKDSEDAGVLTSLLSTKVRKDAIELRKLLKSGAGIDEIEAVKQRKLQEVYGMLCKILGQPPEKFNYEYVDRNSKYNIIQGITPMEFYKKYVGVSLDDYTVIGNIPMYNKEYGKLYKEKGYIANVKDQSNQYFLNLKIEDLKDLVVQSLKNGEPVYFACNVSRMSNRDLEIFDDEIYQYDKILGIDLSMSKGELFEYREISFEHLMVFTGVNIVNDVIDRWKVENSWGDEKQNKGFFVMNDNFFEKYVLHCVINKKYLSNGQLRLLDQDPVLFDPWEPIH